ncbi:HAD-IA family hydrolase [Longispora albida]|uniref:HAD-IA family hydrolase n=1 Tax=Longispora albida TaxID=203523 RepID=UPI000374F064|nr:HAD-IA family hydrolase [Longispora albida]
MRDNCRALLLDFDGVLRHFPAERLIEVEAAHDLPPGMLAEIAFHHSLGYPLVEGKISHAEWQELTADALAPRAWPPHDLRAPLPEGEQEAARTDGRLERARAAVADWQAHHGTVDPVILDFVREVRAAGIPVALCSNATDRLDADLAELGVAGEFDVVINSSVIGLRKPDKAYYLEAAAKLGVPAKLCLLVDDSHTNVQGARVSGTAAYRYTGHKDLAYIRKALGLPAR